MSIGGERIPACTVLWSAGVRASPILASLGVPLDSGGRVVVQPDLGVPGHPEIFVVGDAAAVKEGDRLVPGVAPAAIQMGRSAGRNAARRLAGKPTEPFHYWDKGSLATIGRRAAVADFGRLRFSGPVAWFLWLTIHLFFLIGFRNRFVVLFSWAWSYLTYQRGASVIVDARRGAGGPVAEAVDGHGAPAAPAAPVSAGPGPRPVVRADRG